MLNDKNVVVLSDTEISVRQKSVNLLQDDDYLFSAEYVRIIGPSFLQSFSNVYLQNEIIIKCGGSIRAIVSKIHSLPKKNIFNAGLINTAQLVLSFLSAVIRSKIKIHSGIWITDKWSHGYFHWITESLTKLIALQKELGDVQILLPLHYQKLKYISQSLDYLKFSYQYLPPKRLVYVSRLYSAKFTFTSGNYNQTLLSELVKRFESPKVSVSNPGRSIAAR